jgi:hypothetical protein
LLCLFPLTMLATYPAHVILPDLFIPIIPAEEYKLLSSSLWSPVSCYFLSGPDIFFSTLFSDTISVCPSFAVSVCTGYFVLWNSYPVNCSRFRQMFQKHKFQSHSLPSIRAIEELRGWVLGAPEISYPIFGT